MIRSGIPGHWFTVQYLSPLNQNVQNSDVGQLELFLSCLNMKQAKRLQNITHAFR